ncbi:MAG: helix-turn-helix domain-containing protein [Chitinophagaceae bacterium]|nr:helix-turn-helix domain-containing protein [Chitinophagaceae bacterium]
MGVVNDPGRPATVADLQQLKLELLREIKKLSANQPTLPQRPWLKSHEVRKLLKISHGTLQHLRDSGQLKFSKVGGIFFYEVRDIEEMLKEGR